MKMNTLVHSEWRLLVEVELLCSQVYRRGSKEDKNMIPSFLKSTIIMQ